MSQWFLFIWYLSFHGVKNSKQKEKKKKRKSGVESNVNLFHGDEEEMNGENGEVG